MKQQKFEVTQVGNITAALKKWKNILSKAPDIMRNADLEKHGGTVFAFSNLI